VLLSGTSPRGIVTLGVISSVAALPWLHSGDPWELSFSSRVVVGHPPWFSAFAEVSAGVYIVEGSPTTFPCWSAMRPLTDWLEVGSISTTTSSFPGTLGAGITLACLELSIDKFLHSLIAVRRN